MNTPGDGVEIIDREIFELHNNLRQNPMLIIPDLEALVEQFDGMLLKRPGKPTLRTKEGADAVKEAIEYLKTKTEMQPLRWCNEIAQASKDHTLDIGRKGLIQHDSSDGKTGVKERLRKYGNVISCYGENMSFHCDTALEVLIQLIVDDGV